jgi:hypothetical protein
VLVPLPVVWPALMVALLCPGAPPELPGHVVLLWPGLLDRTV